MNAPHAVINSPSKYEQALNAAWAAHCAPREPDAPTVISTFAGGGGSSLGYSMAGFRELLATDWDANAAATFRLNFPTVLHYHGDIADLSVERVLEMTGLQPGELDVFDGSPPCQGFSMQGQRNINDNRNQLFREYVRLLKGLQPKCFVMENVYGMVQGKMKLIFVEALQELKAAGYEVSARLLNAMHYGVPQHRPRLIFVGVRKDLGTKPSFPSAATWPIRICDALDNITVDEVELQMLREAGERYVAYREWPLLRPGQKKTDVNPVGGGFTSRKLDPRKPCPTVCKNDGNISMHGPMHWSEQRRFTVAEYKRFCSFPDQFHFAGEWQDAVYRMGNSVPPLLMKHLALHIRGYILKNSENQAIEA